MKWFRDFTNVLKLLVFLLIALIIWVGFNAFQKVVLLGKGGVSEQVSQAFSKMHPKQRFAQYLDYLAVRTKWFLFGSLPNLSNEQIHKLRTESKDLGSFVGKYFSERAKLFEKYDLQKEKRYQH